MKNAISKNPIKKRNLIPRRGRASISVNGIEWDTKQWEKNLQTIAETDAQIDLSYEFTQPKKSIKVKLQTSPKPNVAKKPKIVKPKKPVQPSIESRAIASEINNMVQEYEELEDFPLVFQNVSKDQYISTKRSRSKNRNLMECQRTSLSSESDWSIRTNLIQETPPSNVEFSPKNIPSDTSVDAVSFSPVGPSVSTTTTTSTKNVPKNIRTALSIDAVRFSPVGASVSATTTTTTKNVPFFNKISQKKIDYLSFLLDICDQSHIDTWDTFSDRWAYNLSPFDSCSKLGEGTYGEVFEMKTVDQISVAVKIIPLSDNYKLDGADIQPQYHKCKRCDPDDGPLPQRFDENGEKLINGDKMLSSSEFIPELAITKELTRFRKGGEDALYRASNFSELVFARVVSGDYPTDLLAEWHRWKCQKKNADDAYNGCPSHYSSRDQLFLVIATAKAGTPLSKFKTRRSEENYSIFFQTAYSLAVAEAAIEFEHRDLHNDNILIERLSRSKKNTTFPISFDGHNVELHSYGVKVTIIDFSLSRMKKDGTALSYDMSEGEFFGVNGEENGGDYQYDIYRMMRDEVNRLNTDWKAFIPLTNLYWLHYLAKKLFCNKKTKLPGVFDRLLKVNCVKEFLTCDEIKPILGEYIVEENGSDDSLSE